jgi:hypothetical protein
MSILAARSTALATPPSSVIPASTTNLTALAAAATF